MFAVMLRYVICNVRDLKKKKLLLDIVHMRKYVNITWRGKAVEHHPCCSTLIGQSHEALNHDTNTTEIG